SPVMCGNGAATGTVRTTMPNWPPPAAWRATRKGRKHPSILPSRPKRSGSIAGAHSCVPTSTAHATWSAHVAKGKSPRAAITSASGVCKLLHDPTSGSPEHPGLDRGTLLKDIRSRNLRKDLRLKVKRWVWEAKDQPPGSYETFQNLDWSGRCDP